MNVKTCWNLPAVSLALLLLVWVSPLWGQMNIQARGLFKGAAVFEINGRQQMLKVGDTSPEGVTLVAADPRRAIIEVDGKQRTLALSKQISGTYQVAEKKEISVPVNGASQYLTTAEINGQRVPVLIDTGANFIALNSAVAKRLGLAYPLGKPTITVATASGTSPGYPVQLNSVDVGGISANRIEAIIIEGDYPSVTLLGMSYLKHVSLRKENGIMYLKSKY